MVYYIGLIMSSEEKFNSKMMNYEELERKIENAIREGGYRSRQEFILEAVRRSLKRERI